MLGQFTPSSTNNRVLVDVAAVSGSRLDFGVPEERGGPWAAPPTRTIKNRLSSAAPFCHLKPGCSSARGPLSKLQPHRRSGRDNDRPGTRARQQVRQQQELPPWPPRSPWRWPCGHPTGARGLFCLFSGLCNRRLVIPFLAASLRPTSHNEAEIFNWLKES